MKKKIALALISILLIAVLAVSLSACIKLGLKKDAVIDKLTENGYSIMRGKTELPFDVEKLSGLSIESSFTAYIEQNTDDGTITLNKLYVYYLGNTKSADTLEQMVNDTKVIETVDGQEKELPLVDYLTNQLGKRCSYYRNDQVILIGDFESISILRSY